MSLTKKQIDTWPLDYLVGVYCGYKDYGHAFTAHFEKQVAEGREDLNHDLKRSRATDKCIPKLREKLLERCAKVYSGNDDLGYVGYTEFWVTDGPTPCIATKQTMEGCNIKDGENRQFHTEKSASEMEAAWKFWNQILKEKK